MSCETHRLIALHASGSSLVSNIAQFALQEMLALATTVEVPEIAANKNTMAETIARTMLSAITQIRSRRRPPHRAASVRERVRPCIAPFVLHCRRAALARVLRIVTHGS